MRRQGPAPAFPNGAGKPAPAAGSALNKRSGTVCPVSDRTVPAERPARCPAHSAKRGRAVRQPPAARRWSPIPERRWKDNRSSWGCAQTGQPQRRPRRRTPGPCRRPWRPSGPLNRRVLPPPGPPAGHEIPQARAGGRSIHVMSSLFPLFSFPNYIATFGTAQDGVQLSSSLR